MSLPASLALYRALTGLAAPILPWVLSRRARAGKEDPTRRHERLGRPDIQRPDGTLDGRTRHGSCPVLAGTKTVANVWAWNREAIYR